jgi:tRNA nucleotidyltransferase (CCA-adding enzyme)
VTDDALARLAAVTPANVCEVCKALQAAGFEAVTVGGAVRDAVLGRTPGDWDVATSAHPDEVLRLFKHTVPTGLQHGTVTIVTGRGEHTHVEVTTYRGEGAYTDARRPDHVVFGVPLIEDLARRDLVVNAIAYDPVKRAIHDPFGGMADLAARRLRAVGNAVDRFTEDGLRVMRAVRFAAQLEFELDPETEAGIGPALPSLAKVSRERVADELRKILAARQPSRGLAIAWRSGIVESILPEVPGGIASWRRDARRWLARVDRAPLQVRFAALLADLASPEAPRDRIDRVVVAKVDGVMRGLKFSNEERDLGTKLVGVAAAGEQAAWTDPEIRRLLADVGRATAVQAVELWKADAVAASGADTESASALIACASAILDRGDALATGELAVGGKDLMTALAIPPGPAVGRLLSGLLDRVLEDPSHNTRDGLIELARGIELEPGR